MSRVQLASEYTERCSATLLTRASERPDPESQTGDESERNWILTQGSNVKQSSSVHNFQPGCKIKEKLKHLHTTFQTASFLTAGTTGKRNEQRSGPIPITGEWNCGLDTQQNAVHRAQDECLLIYHMEEPRKPRASGVSQSQRLDTIVLTHVQNRGGYN